MRVGVLVSTMNQSDCKALVSNMRISTDYVIINQLADGSDKPKDEVSSSSKFLSYSERGLSKSRNRAIMNSEADVCVLADDDMFYVDDYEEIIRRAYDRYPDADVVSFYVDCSDPRQNRKRVKPGKLNIFQTMRISSCQITFKKEKVVQNGIIFDKRFGSGSDISMGEENIFLFDCIRKGLKIYSCPEKIATLMSGSVSSWFKGYDEKYFIDLGRIYYRMSPLLCIFFMAQFALRKRSLYRQNLSGFQCFRNMCIGVIRQRRKGV